MWQLLAPIISSTIDHFADNKKRKQEIEQAIHVKEIERITTADVAAGDADVESIKRRTWTDEYLVILTTLPVLVLFLEPVFNALFLDTYVAGAATKGVVAGFEALAKMPEYMWWALGLVYIDVLGFRRMFRVAIENMVSKRFDKIK